MTELKSIWHKPSETPTEHKTIFAQHKSLRDGSIECFMWEIQEFTNAIRKDTIAWCYLDDLLACEKELADTKKKLDDLSDKIGKLKSELDIAVDGITYMRNNCLDYAADYMDYADGILEQIKDNDKDVK